MSSTSRQRNHALAAWMRDSEVSAAALAERVNQAVERATGKPGAVTERTVFRWLSGENTSPQRTLRDALEEVTAHSYTDLGFVPRVRRNSSGAGPGIGRRALISLVTASTFTSATAASAVSRPTLGRSDAERLRLELADLWRADDKVGGALSLERRAAALAERTLSMQQNGSAAPRVRARLYALAAAFYASAMFSAMDARRLPAAQNHLEKAVTSAGLSGDTQVQHQVWRNASMLFGQRGRYPDALAAAEACEATRIHRRDPLYSSLTHSRIALAASNLGDRPRAERALGRAGTALEAADLSLPRSVSVGFYTPGELQGLSGIVYSRLGMPERAEFHTYQCLASLRDVQHRNRAYYRAQIAQAQVEQGDIEQAFATATGALTPGTVPTGRVAHTLRSFTATLQQRAAHTAVLRDWQDHLRSL